MVRNGRGMVKGLSPLCMKMTEDEVPRFSGGDTLYMRFQKIREAAPGWLKDLGKNGFKHSTQLERYLEALTDNDNTIDLISPAEVFVLLCAVYLHDIGYWLNGERVTDKHPQRSHDMILENLSKYLLSDFPVTKGRAPRSPKAIALVCQGHSEERFYPLAAIPNEFADAALLDTATLDLRKLSALMRLVDEADDAYIRLSGTNDESIRADIPLVTIKGNTIIWHWDKGEMQDSAKVEQLLQEKKKNLVTSIDYLHNLGFPKWYLVLDPQIGDQPPPFMPPAPVKTFVGRTEDLKTLHKKIQKNRHGAITGLVGTGGIGKTELALVYAHNHMAEYRDGVFWASLKGSTWRSEALKIHRVIKPGEAPPVFADDMMAKRAVQEFLRGKDALLIIDNVNEADEVIAPDCYALVTTRNKTAFDMILPEAVHNLSGLSDEEGKDLMRRILGPERVQRDEDSAGRIVTILGGMPLALDIAVNHLYDALDMSFTDYIGSVNGKIKELKIPNNEDRDVEASLLLSLEQLDGTQNGRELIELFKAASMCAESGFDSQALWATAGLQGSGRKVTAELVGTLHRRSLLLYDEVSGRYSMHPLLRQLSEDMVQKDEDDKKNFRRNHFNYFLAYVKGHDIDVRKLIAEKDNIWQALIHAGILQEHALRGEFINRLSSPFWKYISQNEYELAFQYLMAVNLINIDDLGEYKLLMTILRPLMNQEFKIEPISREMVLSRMAGVYYRRGEYRRAIELHEQSLVIARRIGDVCGEGVALGNIGMAYADLGEYRRAIELYEQALVIDRRIGNVLSEGAGLGNIGIAYDNLGESNRAIELHEQSLVIARRIGDVCGEGAALGNMGSAYLNLGEYRRAIELCEQALVIARRIGNVLSEGTGLGNMGSAYLNLGESHRAIELYEQRLVIARRIGDVCGEGAALGNMGSAYYKLGEYRRAIELYEQQLDITRRIGDVRGEGATLGNMGLAYAALGEYRRAIELYEQQLDITRRIGDVCGEGAALGNMGMAYAALGEKEFASHCFEQSITIYKKIGLVHMVQKMERVAAKLSLGD